MSPSSSPSSALASTDAPPIPSRPVVAPYSTISAPGVVAFARTSAPRAAADAHRVDEAVGRVALVEDDLSADVRDADTVAVMANTTDGTREVVVRRPEQAVEQGDGACPIAEMSRRIPPTLIAAPWNGSTAGEWLWLSTLNETASPSPRSTRLRSRQALEHARPLASAAAAGGGEVLVAAVLRPEQREHGKLEVVELATQQRDDAVELPVREAELAMERLFRDLAQEASLAGGRTAPPRSRG